MDPALRILIIEDLDLDAQLLVHELTKAGYAVEARRVREEAEFCAALNEAGWQLVVCDYQLPRFNARRALELLRAHDPELPFIVVSDRMGEEAAVEMMRRGAQDYLLKIDLARFVPVVRRELREVEHRRARRQAERQLQRLSQVVEQADAGVIITDSAGRIEYANPALTRLTGYTREELYGQTPRILKSDRHKPAFYAQLWRTVLAGDPFYAVFANRKKNGELFYEEKTITPLRNEAGRITHFVSTGQDITQRRAAEEALRQAHAELERRVVERTAELSAANARLQELDRLKSEFLATMSHELRTPLNSIIGFTGVVKSGMAGPVSDEQQRQLGMAYSAAQHLLTLINDLLDVSRIEAGKVRLEKEPFDFAEVVGVAVGQLKPLAQAKRLVLRAQLPPGPLPMVGDRGRCLQVLLNLVQNAVKFTAKGSIDLVVRVEPEAVRLDVIDTGVGIKPEHMGQLFEAFRQVDGSARRAYEGTGLGLYLCRRLILMMGGEISAHSVYGQGTHFEVRVPCTLPAEVTDDSSLPPEPPNHVCENSVG
ncbi:MAG: PAS domain S-box protein [Opitutae bacterium]|nr:PAS domain S-box protein [Opitutae bacterium]